MTETLANPCGGSSLLQDEEGASSDGPRDASSEALLLANLCYRQRRLRDQYFGGKLFRDPAWDILLDLFIAGCLGKKISVTSACCAARIPAPTGLRWLTKLEKLGLISRCREAGDARLVYVEITAEARDQMKELLGRYASD